MPNVSGGEFSTAVQRLKQDYIRLCREPVPYITAEPLPSNIFEWHYVIKGPSDSPYKDGFYHGKLLFPREFPFRPPSIYMLTPNGRFACNTRLCLSISDYHPDTWNPAWSVSSILVGLLSFMLEDTHTMGSIRTTVDVKRQFARSSAEFNMASEVFRDLFPTVVQEIRTQALMRPRSAPGGTSFSNTSADRVDGRTRQISSIIVLAVFSVFAILFRVVMQFLSEPL